MVAPPAPKTRVLLCPPSLPVLLSNLSLLPPAFTKLNLIPPKPVSRELCHQGED